MKLIDAVRKEFDSLYPFSLISNVILYRNDRGELDLFANEIDYLFHYMEGDKNHLVIIEVKEKKIHGVTPTLLPTSQSPWNLNYLGKTKDIKKQVRDQATALKQFCYNVSNHEPEIECWIVDKRKHSQDVISDPKNRKLKLLTFNGFKRKITQVKSVVGITHSDYLRELRLGIPASEVGHPEIPNAIRFISTCRKCLDDQIFRFFRPKRQYYAINGCAGMGKSVLLAYSLFVFASDYAVDIEGSHIELASFKDRAKKFNLPEHDNRRIYVYAVKKKQVDALKTYWEEIKRQISLLNPNYQPALRTPTFGQWSGSIPEDCNILVIDEAHDLSHKDQQVVANWAKQSSNKYLLVACDRNQALKRKDSEEDIIAGLNFTGHSTRLNRIYRCPFPVYVASIGLLFRWFAQTGGGIHLSSQRLREHFGFKPRVEEYDEKMLLTMRNDCHPGNNWKQTVGSFKNCTTAATNLSLHKFDRKHVLWARFQKTDPEFDYTDIQREYTFVDLIAPDSSNEVDLYIKGQEFAIVIVEGLPENINPTELTDRENWGKTSSESEREMWKIRRNIYVVCSRASAFLYFIINSKITSKIDNQELQNLIDQVSRPLRRKNESGQIWKFEVITPRTKRKPLVFRDVEDEAINPRVIEIESVLNVPNLASVLGATIKEVQYLLPQGSKAKDDVDMAVLPDHAKVIASQFGYQLESSKSGKKLVALDPKTTKSPSRNIIPQKEEKSKKPSKGLEAIKKGDKFLFKINKSFLSNGTLTIPKKYYYYLSDFSPLHGKCEILLESINGYPLEAYLYHGETGGRNYLQLKIRNKSEFINKGGFESKKIGELIHVEFKTGGRILKFYLFEF